MRSLIHLTCSTARNSSSRTMSSLAPGHLLQGAHWGYRIVDAVKGDNTHASAVFKARVLPRENASNAPHWAIIKNASPDDETATENLSRERQTYLLPGVASATCFRQMYEVLDKHTIALEWLDTTLADVKYQPDMRTYALIKAVIKEALASCAVLASQQYVNTDYKPANILLSSIETGRVIAKVGDLGLVVPAGHLFNAQPYAMRAPEVFLGQACTQPSQVWAVAAMLLCWIKPRVLGVGDSPHPFINEPWCMAKIKRLFPNWYIPPPDEFERPTLKAEVEVAISFAEEEQIPEAISPFEEETRKVEIPEQLRDLLRLMLVVNPGERPSASAVLASREFRAFQML
ncbi:kinase-like protein [Byssothecium circinans]|uniref:Kinase-like protein n=1 Tax=Byssothecium circinans TaxID=147558 RepID=A0A6A5TCJ5_9PLEO|nr:kinase-like protein [Byssothecium circinans]